MTDQHTLLCAHTSENLEHLCLETCEHTPQRYSGSSLPRPQTWQRVLLFLT